MLLACRLAGLSGLKRTMRASSQWRNLLFHPRAQSLFRDLPACWLATWSRFAKWATRSLSTADKESPR
jgi:hypothetical protein